MSNIDTEVGVALAYADAHRLDTLHHEIEEVVTAVHDAQLRVSVIDHERRLDAPRRHRGHTTLHTPESFIEWVKTSAARDHQSMVFADIDRLSLTAVLDPSTMDTPRWASARGAVTLRPTPEWDAWSKVDGVLLKQADFAEHVTRWAHTFYEPPAMDMRDVAESLVIYGSSKCSNAVRTRDGQRSIVFEETLTTSACNAGGQVDVPEQITLRVPIFDGTDPEDVHLLLLFRKDVEGVKFGVQVIDRPGLLRRAFSQVVAAVAEGLGLIPLWGSAPDPIAAISEVG